MIETDTKRQWRFHPQSARKTVHAVGRGVEQQTAAGVYRAFDAACGIRLFESPRNPARLATESDARAGSRCGRCLTVIRKNQERAEILND